MDFTKAEKMEHLARNKYSNNPGPMTQFQIIEVQNPYSQNPTVHIVVALDANGRLWHVGLEDLMDAGREVNSGEPWRPAHDVWPHLPQDQKDKINAQWDIQEQEEAQESAA